MIRYRRYYLAGFIAALSLGLLFASGCGKARKWEDLSADEAWLKITKLFDRGRYLDASDRLEIFLINHAGSAMADSAQYLLGECHFKMKEYIVAASEYEKTVRQYPQSPVREQAQYKIGLSYFRLSPKSSLDQEYTSKAMDAFQEFIEEFPASDLAKEATRMIGVCREKLAKKEYDNGRLYHKMKEYNAARVYYDSVLDDYYDTSYAPLALYYKALSFEGSHDDQAALEAFSLFLERFPEHSYTNRALFGLNRVRERLLRRGGAGSEGKTGEGGKAASTEGP